MVIPPAYLAQPRLASRSAAKLTVPLAELQRRIVQTQIDETVFAARVCNDCLSVRPIRNRRTRVLQTLFGTVRVAAPRIKICACVMRWSPRGAHRVAVVRAAVLDGRLTLERALSEAA